MLFRLISITMNVESANTPKDLIHTVYQRFRYPNNKTIFHLIPREKEHGESLTSLYSNFSRHHQVAPSFSYFSILL